jgi:small conductance mechanosensitive channel
MSLRPLAAVLAALILSAAAPAQEATTVPPDLSAALELDTSILKAQLRPLTKDTVALELDGWLELLRAECTRISEVEVAVIRASGEAEVEELNEERVKLRGERSKLIERVDVVIAALEAKGGDVEEARAYVSSVVAVPTVTGWRAGVATARAWLVSRDGGLELARRIGLAALILAAAWALARLLAALTARALKRLTHTTALIREFAVKSVSRLVLAFGILAALAQLGVSMTPMLAAIGAAGLVIGLALQDTLGNLASGLMILVYRPFDAGDVVETGGASGRVSGMSLMTTTLMTFDNQVLHVPNSRVWNDLITNKTASSTRRVDMTFGVSYGDDLQKTQSVLEEVVRAHPKVLADPEPNVRVHALADSSINFIVRPWVKTDDYWEVFWDLNRTVKERFDQEGITIPFPQRDLHMFQAGASPEAPSA